MTDTNINTTPAPWEVELLEDYRRNPVRVVDSECKSDVAIISCGGDVSRQEAIANAHLIASAPDLLAACMAVANMADYIAEIDHTDNIEEWKESFTQLANICAKAIAKSVPK